MRRTADDIKRTAETGRWSLSCFGSRQGQVNKMREDIDILLAEIDKLEKRLDKEKV